MKFKKINNQYRPYCAESQKHIEKHSEGDVVDLSPSDKDPGSINMLRTWRGWMKETAVWMQHRGCTMPMYINSQGDPKGSRPYNEKDAHEQFTGLYLGTDDQGRRKSWTMSKKDPDSVQASIGDRLWAMDSHLAWCTQYGIKLTIPNNSEYSKLKAEQGEHRMVS